ncbi:hypothetical protein ACJ72_08141 [Emergomyces africanus]|uniref:RING zinc finger-like domain-containing protein n=1 Tax=Emergomyces africanus TaxID=1955775 RepID=A0A1B7NL48_9EURO|nr:hypothetical protein ACJ72_08141 [Emergomyces africanus]
MRRERMRSSIELPPLRDHFKQESIPSFQSSRPRELLPSILSHSPPGRSSTLPPIQRRERLQRSRKGSLTQSARRGKHERNKSKEYGRRPSLNDRKALSAEPQTAAWVQGKRWEDLIEAATSATEVDDRDLTPIPKSPPYHSYNSVTSAPSATKHRSSLPPAFQSTPGLPTPQPHYRQFPPPLSYTASPLQKALTPPPYEPHGSTDNDLEPFPSIESSLDSNSSISGKNFHMSSSGLPTSANSDSSPVQPPRPLTSSYPPSSHPQQLQNHNQHHQQHHPLHHHHHHHQQQQQLLNHPHNHRIHHRLSNPTPMSTTSTSSITSAGVGAAKDTIHIYCACCSRPWPVRDCFACTNCICGVCRECVSVVMAAGLQTTSGGQPASILNPTTGSPGNGVGGTNNNDNNNNNNVNNNNNGGGGVDAGSGNGHGNGNGNGNGNANNIGGRAAGLLLNRRGCPHCGTVNGQWKTIQLDFR